MIARISTWREMERWIPGSEASWEAAFPLVPIGDVMRSRRKVVNPGNFSDYRPITIHFDGSIEIRDRSEPFKGSMFAVLPGDLVFSKIDLRNGAIGLLPAEINQAVVTSEYPVFVPDGKQLDARYLAMLLARQIFYTCSSKRRAARVGASALTAIILANWKFPCPICQTSADWFRNMR